MQIPNDAKAGLFKVGKTKFSEKKLKNNLHLLKISCSIFLKLKIFDQFLKTLVFSNGTFVFVL